MGHHFTTLSDHKPLQYVFGETCGVPTWPQLTSSCGKGSHRLLQKKVAWTWGPDQQQAFDQVESALISDRALEHYDPSKTLILTCDATPYVMSAVLSHQLEDGPEKPVAFASRSLAPAEKYRYSQFDKEGLAIVFGVKCFHQYLVGHHFTTLSDH